MATGGSDFSQPSTSSQHANAETAMTVGVMKSKSDSVRCGSCNHPSTEAKCKFFRAPCDMFVCKDCIYHVNVADDADKNDDDYIHETKVTVGAFAKQLAETKKKQLEEQLLRYENIKNIKLEYREYLEHCVAKCQSGEVIFQKAVNEINYDLKRLHDVGAELQSKFDSLKEVYKRHDALMLVRRRHSWKDYTSELSGIERRGNPRVCMSDEGGVSKQYPTVTLENHCFFRETTGQDLCPKKVGRAWILHAGSLYLQAGGYHFWEDYYQSQIRPFVTLAEGRNDEVLVFLTQISGFVGQWSRNDLEMSGQPYFESITTDRHGSSFVLGESGENIVYVHRDSNVAKVI